MLILLTVCHIFLIFYLSLTDFQNFQGSVAFFLDLPVLGNATIKFQDPYKPCSEPEECFLKFLFSTPTVWARARYMYNFQSHKKVQKIYKKYLLIIKILTNELQSQSFPRIVLFLESPHKVQAAIQIGN